MEQKKAEVVSDGLRVWASKRRHGFVSPGDALSHIALVFILSFFLSLPSPVVTPPPPLLLLSSLLSPPPPISPTPSPRPIYPTGTPAFDALLFVTSLAQPTPPNEPSWCPHVPTSAMLAYSSSERTQGSHCTYPPISSHEERRSERNPTHTRAKETAPQDITASVCAAQNRTNAQKDLCAHGSRPFTLPPPFILPPPPHQSCVYLECTPNITTKVRTFLYIFAPPHCPPPPPPPDLPSSRPSSLANFLPLCFRLLQQHAATFTPFQTMPFHHPHKPTTPRPTSPHLTFDAAQQQEEGVCLRYVWRWYTLRVLSSVSLSFLLPSRRLWLVRSQQQLTCHDVRDGVALLVVHTMKGGRKGGGAAHLSLQCPALFIWLAARDR